MFELKMKRVCVCVCDMQHAWMFLQNKLPSVYVAETPSQLCSAREQKNKMFASEEHRERETVICKER